MKKSSVLLLLLVLGLLLLVGCGAGAALPTETAVEDLAAAVGNDAEGAVSAAENDAEGPEGAVENGAEGAVSAAENFVEGAAADGQEAPAADDAGLALVGMWRNAGEYSEGRDFVETLTLNEDGSCTIHLDYQGADYQTLTGTYELEGGFLHTHLEDGQLNRSFRYTLDGRELILETDRKTVTYIKVD